MKGTIFNIQRYAIHDGPGIRTTVFLKGCPLKCIWCHNPESQKPYKEIMYIENRCIGCYTCVQSCEYSVIDIADKKLHANRDKCVFCMKCVENCPTAALETVGKEVSVDWLMKEIKKDLVFYDQSGGGVTFSGGEPLLQIHFLNSLLEACRELGIHTTIDTSGYTSWEKLSRVASKTNLVLYDIKLMDDNEHKKYTGVSNKAILDNLLKLSKTQTRIIVRIPIIPGINDDNENINKIGELLSDTKIQQVSIIPYHNIGMDKYNRLNREYKLPDLIQPSNKKINEVHKILEEYNLSVKIGG